ncbi:MAG: hypothetical protein KGZ92_06820 [Firmicutes bacterium]|nr:hypothetical protein [Dethiobacter sp.]MBS3888994.1 hypothetical protein [Bacillota bacterium]
MSRKALGILVVATLLCGILLSYQAPPATASPRIAVTVNGRALVTDVAPEIRGGRTLVPFRAIFESLGATVEWDERTATVRGTRGHITVTLPIGQRMAFVNGAPVNIDVAPQIISGRTMVPGRFVAETLGSNVEWNAATNTVAITSPVEPRVGGEMVYALSGDPTTLNPLLSTDTASNFVISMIHSGLLRTNERLEITGDLAEDWTVSADNLTLTFRIRRGVQWHDGKPLTAADIKFTYDTIMHPDYTGVRRRDFRAVREITTPDDHTLVMRLSEVDASLLSKLFIGIIPRHIFQGHPVARLREHPNSRSPIGTGPYHFGSWLPQQQVVLNRNPNYFWAGQEPYIQRVRFRIIPDTQAQLVALEAGQIDYMGSIPVDDIERVRRTHANRLQFREVKQNGYWHIGMKQDHPIFRDLRVRQALMYSLDRPGMVQTLFKGYGTVIHGDKPPVSWAHNPNLYTYPFNQAKARQLLDQAGWSRIGTDGIRMNAAGQRLTFELISASGDQTRENMLNIIRNQWRAVGVDMRIELIEISVYFGKLDTGQFEIYQWGWNLGIDPDNFIFFHSTSGFNAEGVLMGFNDVGYSNPAVDRLIERGRATFNQEERRKIYWEIQEILNRDLPYVFLYNRNNIAAHVNRIRGIVWTEIGTTHFEKWFIDPATLR